MRGSQICTSFGKYGAHRFAEGIKTETDWLWSALVMLAGVPGAWAAWYWPLYRTARTRTPAKCGFLKLFKSFDCNTTPIRSPLGGWEGTRLSGCSAPLEDLQSDLQ